MPQFGAAGAFLDRSTPSSSAVSRQVSSLRSAARVLSLGGFEKESAELEARAVKMEQELKRAQAPVSPESLVYELRELRQSLDGLREELRALRLELQHADAGQPEANMVPRLGHGARIRLQDRGSKIPDEELDAAPSEKRTIEQLPKRSILPAARKPAADDVEFELVPVPELPKEEQDTVPTPVPTPATPEK